MEEVGHLLTSREPSRFDLDQDRLLVKVARLYYEADLTQAQIAGRMRLSRQKVQRLLDQAEQGASCASSWSPSRACTRSAKEPWRSATVLPRR